MKKTIYIITLALAIVYISGCSKLEDFGTTNVNPAATNTPITAALLTNVLSGIGGYATTNLLQPLYCQYFSETQYPDASCYSLIWHLRWETIQESCTIWRISLLTIRMKQQKVQLLLMVQMKIRLQLHVFLKPIFSGID